MSRLIHLVKQRQSAIVWEQPFVPLKANSNGYVHNQWLSPSVKNIEITSTVRGRRMSLVQIPA